MVRNEPEPVIRWKKLSYRYPNKTLALDEVSLDIAEGSRMASLGPNGAGKSTLFLHFNGILKPREGKVLFEGKEIKYGAKALEELRAKVAIVLQNPDDQIFSATVEEDVAFGPMNLGPPQDEVEAPGGGSVGPSGSAGPPLQADPAALLRTKEEGLPGRGHRHAPGGPWSWTSRRPGWTRGWCTNCWNWRTS